MGTFPSDFHSLFDFIEKYIQKFKLKRNSNLTLNAIWSKRSTFSCCYFEFEFQLRFFLQDSTSRAKKIMHVKEFWIKLHTTWYLSNIFVLSIVYSEYALNNVKFCVYLSLKSKKNCKSDGNVPNQNLNYR